MPGLTALVGLHEPMIEKFVRFAFSKRNYAVTSTSSPDEMLRLAQASPYSCYLMDLNLGTAESDDVTPAVEVYELVRARVEKGEAHFIGITGLPKIVDAGLAKGIPSAIKPFNVRSWLEEITPSLKSDE